MATAGFSNGGVWYPPHVYPKVEQMGFDTIWTGEHLMLWRPILAAIPLMAGIAACTETIEIGSSIILFPPRHPLVLAKELTTLDHMSGGRLVVGAGAGGDYRKELEATGVQKNFGKRFNEMLDIIQLFWTEDWVNYSGDFFEIEEAGLMEPKPVRDGHIPILIGGRSEAAITRAIVHGDGYQPYMFHARRVATAYDMVRTRADELGVELATDYRWSCFVHLSIDNDEQKAWDNAHRDMSWRYNQDATGIVDKYVLKGSPERVREGIQEYIDAGVEDFCFSPIHDGSLIESSVADAEQTKSALDCFELIAEEIVPFVQAS